ncbi:MAG: sugar phosphate isomerase/epimerase [Intrasporangium sp.]|uniref:sugar phosphate isomerase/epimerase family protein n=1 Tax=Intrasporangium sp. TaxID=1925024 RepID=UPI002647A3C8|nr:sugar phosphate isomerase/epimerase [Intrasporangium sp.]MDN5795440.1 sugar phosphate isomerase/epimerase [Intrasporangium sp.]
MTIRVGLSTASVYPDNAATAFATAARLGYTAMEVMVWTDPVTQEPGALRALSELHGIPIVSVHAPTLLLTQRIWGADPWGKVDRSMELALEVGADVVVLHPPFRWQREYAAEFVEGVADRERDSGLKLAVENMFPWITARRQMLAYLPHWNPLDQPYRHVTLDLSHAATAGVDGLQMARELGPRLAHLHLTDGLETFTDDHLVPGHGTQPCSEVLQMLADTRYTGHVIVEVGTRKLTPDEREIDLIEALTFAELHLMPSRGVGRI